MGMLEIFKGTLQDGMEIIKEKELVNGFKVTLSYNGMTADTNIPKAVVSGREKDVCKSSINNAMSTMYINAGNIEEAKAWLDGEKWIESNNERTDKQKLLDVIISDIDNKKAEMKDDPKIYIGLDMAREIVWSYYHGDFMSGDEQMKNNTDPFIWNEVIHKMFTEDLKMSMKSDKGISRLLDEIDNSVTSDELLLNGELIDDSGDYEQYYADAPGGEYHRIRIIKYDGKFYVYKEKVTVDRDCNEKAECVAFYELR